MRQLVLLAFSALFCLSSYLGAEDGTCFVVLNGKTGRILSQQGAHRKLYPASTTKIALLAYVLSSNTVDLDQKLVVPAEAVKSLSEKEKAKDNFSKYPSYILESVSTIAGFQAGEVITLRDALYGMMLPSGNDAANTLAYYWGNGSIPACVDKLNAFVASLGCQDTHFMNPHGLPHPQHYSTAYDLAIMASYAMQNPDFKKIVGTASYVKEKTNKQPAVTWGNINKLILPGPFFCELANGIKTGHHAKAQHCLVASGEIPDRSIIVVLLHCPDRKQMFLVARKLLTRYLEEPKKEKLIVPAGKIELERELEGHSTPLSLKTQTPFSISYFPSEEPAIRVVAAWYELRFPIKEGQEVGALKVFADEKEVASTPLYSAEHRSATWRQRFLETQSFMQSHKTIVFFAAICVIGLAFFVFKRRR
jgi:D-alanyl-D-alanine carboxypeptidase (penicillin-binding protein 5/6)